MSGAAAGKETPIESIDGGIITVSSAFDGTNGKDALDKLAVGDEIMIDNSDYLAIQTFQRHQVLDKSYHVYDQYRDSEGNPKYPQAPMLVAPFIAMSGGGCIPDGSIHGKVICVCSLLDESAFAWHGDWYRNAVRRAKGGDERDCFRLYYNDHCIHDDRAEHLDDPQHQVDYLGILHQALLDVADWCEKGIAPLPTTNYRIVDGQVEIPQSAEERGGLQPVVEAYANQEKCLIVKAGEPVIFTARIEVPRGAGQVTSAAWDFERTGNFREELELHKKEGGRVAETKTEHAFTACGTYFPVIKVKSNRKGTKEDIFTQCKNLDRVRVVVV